MRNGLMAAFVLVGASGVLADTGPGLLMTPFEEGRKVEAAGNAVFFGQSGTDVPHRGLTLSMYDTDERWRILPGNKANPTLGHQLLYLNLETNDPRLPKQLFDESVAFGMGIAEVGNVQIGFTAGVGYSGTHPYNESQSFYGKGSLIANWKVGRNEGVLAYLDYNPSSTLFPDIPHPGIGYYNTQDPKLSYLVGLPYAGVTYKPMPRLTLQAQYAVPATLDASASYEVIDHVQVFLGYRDLEWAFRQQQGVNRLFFDQRRVEAGLVWKPCKMASLTLAGGYAFNGEFQSGFDTRNLHTVTHLSDTPFLRAGFELAF